MRYAHACCVQEAQQRCSDLSAENARLRANSGGGASVRQPSARRGPDPTREPVDRLNTDFANRKATLDDDLSFIQEVVTGAATAIPDFNPEVVRPAPYSHHLHHLHR